MPEGFHREGQPMDVTFSSSFSDNRDDSPKSAETWLNQEKTLHEQENVGGPETGLNFVDEVRDVVVRGEKRKMRQQGLFDRLKTHSLMLASALGISAGSFAMLDSETRNSVVEKAQELMAVAQFGDKEQQELAAQAKQALSKDLKDMQREGSDEQSEVERRKQLIDVHMKVLELKGGVSHEETTRTKEYIERLVTKYQKMKREGFGNHQNYKEKMFSDLFELSKETGRYEPGKARISSIANDGVGNCEAKALLRRLVVPFVYPESELKFQHFGPGEKTSPDQGATENAGHVRMIMRIEKNWYALEDGVPQKLAPNDLVGTLITDIDVFEKSLLGEHVGGKPVKSEGAVARESTAKTNSLFDLQFDTPPTRSLPGGISQTETLQEFNKRQRLEYTAAGQTLDPENLPPLKVYIGETLEDVSAQMGGGEKKEDMLKPEDPHELPEDRKMRAMIDGVLDLSGKNVFYDLSALHGVELKAIYGGYFGIRGKVADKYAQEFTAHFSKVPEISLSVIDKSSQSVADAFETLKDLSVTRLDGTKTDLNFLRGKDTLKRFSLIGTNGTVDLEPLGGHQLESLRLSNHVTKEGFKNLIAVDTSMLKAVSIDTILVNQEIEKFIAGISGAREFQLNFETQEGKNFKIFDSVNELKTKNLERFTLTMLERPIQGEFTFDLTKISSQPLTNLELWGISAERLEALEGMPLENLTLEINCETTDISPLKKLPKLQNLEIICNGEISSEVGNFVQSLPVREKRVRKVGDGVDDDQDYLTQRKLGVRPAGE